MNIQDARIGQDVEVSFRGVIVSAEGDTPPRVCVRTPACSVRGTWMVSGIPVEYVHLAEEPKEA